jgi:glucosamine-6-phosphate deaminase
VFSTSDAGCFHVANLIVSRINDFAPTAERPFVMGLPTGSSPEQVYKYLVEANQQGRVSFKHVVTFNMDEYVGLSPSNDQSYHYFMFKHLFNHIDIPRENINILNGLAENVDVECARYEEKIKNIGGIHLFLGGIGPNGHIAFNEAGSSVESVTRKVALAESTVVANSRFFASPLDVPRYALSVGISTVLGAKEVVILAFGSAKAKAVKQSLLDQVSSACPGSYMRLHDNSLFVLDEAAATEYTKKTDNVTRL